MQRENKTQMFSLPAWHGPSLEYTEGERDKRKHWRAERGEPGRMMCRLIYNILCVPELCRAATIK